MQAPVIIQNQFFDAVKIIFDLKDVRPSPELERTVSHQLALRVQSVRANRQLGSDKEAMAMIMRNDNNFYLYRRP